MKEMDRLLMKLRERDQVGKLSSFVFKIQYKQCQKQLRLLDMEQYIAKDITDYHAQASSIFSKIKSMFNDNHLKLPKSTRIAVRGQNKEKEYFILALITSISEAPN